MVIIVPSNNMNLKLVHWPLMGWLLHVLQRGGDWTGPEPARPLFAVPNVTADLSTTSVPITALLYDGSVLCNTIQYNLLNSSNKRACSNRFVNVTIVSSK